MIIPEITDRAARAPYKPPWIQRYSVVLAGIVTTKFLKMAAPIGSRALRRLLSSSSSYSSAFSTRSLTNSSAVLLARLASPSSSSSSSSILPSSRGLEQIRHQSSDSSRQRLPSSVTVIKFVPQQVRNDCRRRSRRSRRRRRR